MTNLRVPDFLGIGVMKGGSSWVWRQLRAHPQIVVPKTKKKKAVKELHFIDRLDMTLKDYLKKFGKIKTEKAGEYTPNYICCPYGPVFVKTYFPSTKLFTIFRNPVDRAFSHYKDHLFYGKIPEGVSFLEAFRKNHPQKELKHYSIKSKGMYGDQLEAWYKEFGKDQLKVMFYDDLVNDPLKFLAELYEWIEVEPYVPSKYEDKVVKGYNQAYDSMVFANSDRDEVADYYKEQVKKLEDLTGRKLGWR